MAEKECRFQIVGDCGQNGWTTGQRLDRPHTLILPQPDGEKEISQTPPLTQTNNTNKEENETIAPDIW